MFTIPLMKQYDNNNQEIGDAQSWETERSTISSNIAEDDCDRHLKELLLGQVRWNKSLSTIIVPLPKKWSHTDTVIACPLLPNSRNPPRAMAPPLLKCHKSTLLNKLSKSDHAPSAKMLLLPKSSGD